MAKKWSELTPTTTPQDDDILAVGRGNSSYRINRSELLSDKADASALSAHTANTNNPHNTTKGQVGLSNVDNTSDAAKPVSTATQAALNQKANTADLHTHSNKATLDATDASFTTAKDTKLAGIATGATANDSDANLKNRANHTGTQAISTVSGLQGELDGKAPTAHSHAPAEVTDLAEYIQDTVAAMLTQGSNITLTYDDGAGTLTIASAGGSGGGGGGEANTASNVGATGAGLFKQKNGVDFEFKKLQAASGKLTVVANGNGNNVDIDLGSVAIADIYGLQAALDGKASSSHTHTIANVTNLQSSLDGKANTSHTHAISDVTNLQSTLDGKAASSHTHAITDVTNLQSSLDAKAASTHTHAIADTTGLQTALDGKAASSHAHAASDITSGVFDIARLAIGTPDGTKFVRDDGTLATPAGGGGGGAAWGGITGTLSDQTDLNTALSGKAASSHTHNASDINAGTIATARLGSGTADSSTFLRGDGSWAAPAGGGGGGSSEPQDSFEYHYAHNAVLQTNGGAVQNFSASIGFNSGGGLQVQHGTANARAYTIVGPHTGWSNFFNSTISFRTLMFRMPTRDANVRWFTRGGSPFVSTTWTDKALQWYCDQSAAFYASNANGTSETRTDVAASFSFNTNTMSDLLAVHTPATNDKFYKGNTLLAAHTTNVPSGAGSFGGMVFYSESMTGTNRETVIASQSLKVTY